MRRSLFLTAVALATSWSVRADEQADLKVLIDKALKAGGGEARISKYKAETFKGRGKFYGRGEGVDYTGEWAVQQPNKLRVRIDSSAGNVKLTFVRVVNGDKVWMKLGDKAQELDDKDQIAEAREASYAAWVVTLVPLRDKAFQLASLGEAKVDGKPALGVRVSSKGRRDINLYFDKDSGLLVKSETRVKDLMAGGKEVTQETLYSDYKEASGVQVPRKIVISRDGKRYVDTEITEIELKEMLDDSVFAKP